VLFCNGVALSSDWCIAKWARARNLLFIHSMTCHKKVFNVISVVGLVFGFWGCDSERPFHSEAIYQAPKAGYEMTISATGVVPVGADIVDVPSGNVEFRPLANQQGKKRMSLVVQSETNASYQFDGENAAAVEWDFRTRKAIFNEILTQAGYNQLNADEIEESLEVMYGVLYGPKAAPLKGQTEFLQVIEVKQSMN